jgi:hypothetical protein
LTTKGLGKGLKRAFKGLLLVNPMHPMSKGLQGLKKGKKKPPEGGLSEWFLTYFLRVSILRIRARVAYIMV